MKPWQHRCGGLAADPQRSVVVELSATKGVPEEIRIGVEHRANALEDDGDTIRDQRRFQLLYKQEHIL